MLILGRFFYIRYPFLYTFAISDKQRCLWVHHINKDSI